MECWNSMVLLKWPYHMWHTIIYSPFRIDTYNIAYRMLHALYYESSTAFGNTIFEFFQARDQFIWKNCNDSRINTFQDNWKYNFAFAEIGFDRKLCSFYCVSAFQIIFSDYKAWTIRSGLYRIVYTIQAISYVSYCMLYGIIIPVYMSNVFENTAFILHPTIKISTKVET